MKIKSGIFMLSVFCGVAGQALALSDENRPEYQKEYDAYLQDLEVIAQTGKAPMNPDLDADLAKMSSNDKILLTASTITSSPKEELLAENDAKILNKVEIIHVPEEFREEYADIYREERGILKTPSLVKDVKKMSDKETKVSEHQNPFQVKKTQPKEDNSEDDSMVNAYFNPFGQPYAAGDKIQPKSSEPKTSQAEDVSLKSSLTSSSESNENSLSSSMPKSKPSNTTSQISGRRKLTSSPIGIKNSMFVR